MPKNQRTITINKDSISYKFISGFIITLFVIRTRNFCEKPMIIRLLFKNRFERIYYCIPILPFRILIKSLAQQIIVGLSTIMASLYWGCSTLPVLFLSVLSLLHVCFGSSLACLSYAPLTLAMPLLYLLLYLLHVPWPPHA